MEMLVYDTRHRVFLATSNGTAHMWAYRYSLVRQGSVFTVR